MELKAFDPADYLDSEEGFQAYLADARLDGPTALSRAVEVVARARARMGKSNLAVNEPSDGPRRRAS